MSAEHAVDGRGAAVRLPPPLLYALPLLVAWAVDRAIPLTLPGRPAITVVGLLLVVAGVSISAWAVLTFRRHHTTVIPHHAVSTFVTAGPYRFSRNPMYVGLSLTYVGASMLLDSWWPLFVLPVILVAVDRLVIAREESYLRGRFGGAYDEFCALVRRWV
jgi:protein-S-isoprenylcysteine O-methyltransferase Ste14